MQFAGHRGTRANRYDRRSTSLSDQACALYLALPTGRADRSGGIAPFGYEHEQRVRNDGVELTPENYLKARVYNFEVEDFHTYYVGEMGVWVHNANCPEMLIQGPNTKVYDVAAAKALPAPHTNEVILVREPKQTRVDVAEFQAGTEGAQVTASGDPAAWSARRPHPNPSPNTSNFVKLGDGRKHMPDGTWSKTFIDSKIGFGPMYKESTFPLAAEGMKASAVSTFQKAREALEATPGYSHTIEFAPLTHPTIVREGYNPMADAIN